jgi:hypothetical protein
MRGIEIPEFPVLRGQDAIDALNEIIKDLEQQKGKELTKKQAKALMKVANELIHSIREEMLIEASRKPKRGKFAIFRKFEGSTLPKLEFRI